jgi:hypothetical protein
MKNPINFHGIVGLLGMATFSGCMATYNEIMGAVAATFTAGYMGIRFVIEYSKWKRKKVVDIKTVLVHSGDVEGQNASQETKET